jgi:hypothetical protein
VLKVSAQPLKIMNTHYCQRAKLFLHGGIVWHLMCNLGSLNAAAAAATLAVRSGMRHFSLFCACGLIIFDCDFQDQRRFAGKRETIRQIAAHDTITQRKNVEHRIDGKLHAPRLQQYLGKWALNYFRSSLAFSVNQ